MTVPMSFRKSPKNILMFRNALNYDYQISATDLSLHYYWNSVRGRGANIGSNEEVS